VFAWACSRSGTPRCAPTPPGGAAPRSRCAAALVDAVTEYDTPSALTCAYARWIAEQHEPWFHDTLLLLPRRPLPGRARRPPRTRLARSATPPLPSRPRPTRSSASPICAIATCSTSPTPSEATPTSPIGSTTPSPTTRTPRRRHRDNSSLPAATLPPDEAGVGRRDEPSLGTPPVPVEVAPMTGRSARHLSDPVEPAPHRATSAHRRAHPAESPREDRSGPDSIVSAPGMKASGLVELINHYEPAA
jgi:hypothetical protein